MSARIDHDYPIEILFDCTPEQLDIPLDWTPLQADKIITTLGHIEERIWTLYGDDLVELARAQTYIGNPPDDNPHSPYNPEDDIPF